MPDDAQPPTQPSTRGGPTHLAETDDRLLWLLRRAGDEWGPLGVALTAALLSDPDAVVGSLVSAGSARPRTSVTDGTYAYLLTDDQLDRLPRISRTPPGAEPIGPPIAARPLNDREVLDLPDTDPRRHPTSIEAPHLIDLDQHPVALRTYAPGLVTFDGRILRIEYDGGDYDVTATPAAVPGLAEALDEARTELARRSAEWDARSREGREQVDRLVASNDALRSSLRQTVEERDDARRQLVDHAREAEQLAEGLRAQLAAQEEASEEQADALRSEVARLSGLLDERSDRTVILTHGDRVRLVAAGNPLLVRLGDWSRTTSGQVIIEAEVVPGFPVDPPSDPEPREETSPHPIAEDPRRPRLDHFPDDAILLTYRELRQLVGLHLEACATAVAPSDSARAMRDGETGLRLAEVLDR